ncbi:MAG: CBS domain-containing protein [Chromatiales bacterium]|jgi:CBS domain-containing protein|nr:CBS domain-containing protein [Chromatiales bacterium]
MRVDNIMEREVITCSPDDTLEAAALLMWNHACGSIPVVSGDGQPIGMVTDRDIAMASVLQHKPLWQIKAGEIANGKPLVCCEKGISAEEAVKQMGEHGVRRLLVVDREGCIQGLFSLDDAIYYAENRKGHKGPSEGLSYEGVMSALKDVCLQQRHR